MAVGTVTSLGDCNEKFELSFDGYSFQKVIEPGSGVLMKSVHALILAWLHYTIVHDLQPFSSSSEGDRKTTYIVHNRRVIL
jgi:hypothetical protein